MEQLTLPIADLDQRHPGLTPAVAACLHEAARVCLDRHHQSPTAFTFHHAGDPVETLVEWQMADDRCRAAHAFEYKATEEGAYACVLAAVEITQSLVAVHQAEKKTGADYYMINSGQVVEDLERCLRLEISGLDRGRPSAVDTRLYQKVQQVRNGRGNLPALAGVVGFQAQLIKIERVEHA